MIKSRCGLLCGPCPYRKKNVCKGCLNMENPPWGEICPVKSCCEGKNLEHCGLCPGFPCEILKNFSYYKDRDPENKRISQCLKWLSKDRIH